MPTELDLKMNAMIASLTSEGGPLVLGSVERFGRRLPIVAGAPPTLSDYFAYFCDQHGGSTFLVAGDERLTFTETHAAAKSVARALVAEGVIKGDRVGIAMRNSPAWIILYMGIVMAGGVATLLNGWWQSEELASAIDEVGCTLVFADAPRVARLRAVPSLAARIVSVDDTRPIGEALLGVTANSRPDTPLPTIGADDHATILFTSGSTGQSKGALSDHRAVVQGTFGFLSQALTMLGIATAEGNPPEGQPATLLNLPLFHVTAEVAVLLQSFALGRKLVLMSKWNAEEAMRLIAQERVTYFVGVPLMSFEILTHPDRANYDLSSVSDFAAGGAPRPVEHVRRIDAEMEGAPLIGYGLTETNAVGTGNWRTNYTAKPNSAGRPSEPLVEIAILDDAGASLAQGSRGEIGIRSAANFLGYWNNPAATEAAFTADGFFRTGDIGFLDEDGYLFIVDRKKDIIIRGGENIACQEVEAALYNDPRVAEAAVFGLPDERFGEVPGAVVHAAEGKSLDPEELRSFLGQHLAGFKVPVKIWLSAAPLPRLGTEKIDKVSLRQQYRASVASEVDR